MVIQGPEKEGALFVPCLWPDHRSVGAFNISQKAQDNLKPNLAAQKQGKLPESAELEHE